MSFVIHARLAAGYATTWRGRRVDHCDGWIFLQRADHRPSNDYSKYLLAAILSSTDVSLYHSFECAHGKRLTQN